MNEDIENNGAKIVQMIINDQAILDDAVKHIIASYPELELFRGSKTEEEYEASAEYALYYSALAEYHAKVLAEAISQLTQ